MRKTESTTLADWLTIILRWIFMLGIVLSAALAGTLSIISFPVILLLGLWNAAALVLAMLNRRLPMHPQIFSMVDLVLGAFLFALMGQMQGPVTWIGLLVCTAGAIYFEWKGGFLFSLGFSLYQIILVLFSDSFSQYFSALAVQIGYNLACGLIIGYFGTLLIRELQDSRGRQNVYRKEIEQRIQKLERERMRSLFSLTTTLTATLNYQRVLDYALDMGSNALHDMEEVTNPILSAVMLFQDGLLQIGSSRRFTATDQRLRLAGDSGVIYDAFAKGEPCICQDPFDDPELGRFVALRSCKSAVVLPLKRGLNLFGIMMFAHPMPDYFTPNRVEILQVISHQVVIAIQNAGLYQDLAEEKQRLIESQDEARKKLARDLHDGPTQSVAAIAMRIDLIRHILDRDPTAARDELAKVEDLARRTSKELRHMLFTLRPLVLETEGLAAALQAMADKVRDTFSQAVSVQVDPSLPNELEINKQTVIFYIAEEAVNNARKHAQAEEIIVRLNRAPGEADLALLEIVDNGVGFDKSGVLDNYEHRGSLGMINLQERTQLVNGLLEIDTAPGKGTHINVFIPLTEAAADRLHQL